MHLHLLPFNNLECTSDLNYNSIYNFLISCNYLKDAFIRKNAPLPAELATIFEPASMTTTTRSSTNSNDTVRCPNINFVLLIYFTDSVALLFCMKEEEPPWLSGYVVRHVSTRYCVQTSVSSSME